MIDQHETERLVDAWWVSKWKALQITIAGLSALAVVTASVIELVNLVR